MAPVLLPESLLNVLTNQGGVCQTIVRQVCSRGELWGIDVVSIVAHISSNWKKKVGSER